MADSSSRYIQIRVFLHVPAEQKITIERYSDSAASFVTLDPTNASVYKQLYRAAKAKSKLKLRVTRVVDESSVEPKPVTVENSPEESSTPSVETETSAPVALDSNFLSSQVRDLSFIWARLLRIHEDWGLFMGTETNLYSL